MVAQEWYCIYCKHNYRAYHFGNCKTTVFDEVLEVFPTDLGVFPREELRLCTKGYWVFQKEKLKVSYVQELTRVNLS